ncbi:hypothetical protein EER27_11955 [Lysobacter psychrotolerans]|uniref:Uncharacterized protein n=1 Tax=Montanilutibacter psychrotolerans TaxID=1327343 RepID=A0A3M8SPL2_9GAMM|nr:hypothetical protein EER27_11955 [Lysobacter psychrotolerans]
MRHLWLAGLGLTVVARREVISGGRRVVRRLATFDAGAVLRDRVEDARGQVPPGVLRFSAEVEARLAPVLEKLGLAKGGRAAPKGRKTGSGKRPAARRQAAVRQPRRNARGA